MAPTPTQKEKSFPELNDIEAKLSDKNAVNPEAIESLQSMVFDKKNLEDPNIRDSQKMTHALELLNSNLDRLRKEDASKAEPLLEKYRAVLLEGCKKPSIRDCRNLRFFAKDPRSALFTKHWAEAATDTAERHLFVMLTFDLSSRESDDVGMARLLAKQVWNSISLFAELKGSHLQYKSDLRPEDAVDFKRFMDVVATSFAVPLKGDESAHLV